MNYETIKSETIKAVEIISREELKNAGLIIFHMKDGIPPENAAAQRAFFTYIIREADCSAKVIATNCLEGVEVSKQDAS